MLYIHHRINKKGIIKLKIRRNSKDIVVKNIWVKKGDIILIEQEYKNNKGKGQYFEKEKKRDAKIKISKKERYIMEKYIEDKLKKTVDIKQ